MMDNIKISIAVPVYSDSTKDGYNNLLILLKSIEMQDYKNIEIVLSDHSFNCDDIELYCKSNKSNLNIKYIKNIEDRGYWPSNLNNAIKHCSGDLIKFMLQDDILLYSNSLSKIVDSYKNNKFMWAAVGAVHTKDFINYYGRIIPQYNENIYLGINTIGGPSCIVIKNEENIIYFDKYLNWMGDCDYYYKLNQKYGPPFVIQEPIIAYKQWHGQFSNTLSDEVKEKESKLVKNKYEKK